MSVAIPDPAFPVNIPDGKGTTYFGMTLRDYFAAAALPAFLADEPEETYAVLAMRAYYLADAMLKSREQS